MKRILLTLALLLSLITFKGYGQCWQQTWADEFDGTSLNGANWDFDLGDGCQIGNCGWGNNELEYYTNSSNNIAVANGQLAITAKYQPNYNGTGKNFTSARLVTRGKFSQTYGRYEARIKVPTASGVWPAFWMLGDNISSQGWPKCGEIDILECKNIAPKVLYETIHYANSTGGHLQTGTTYTSANDLSNDFHIYALEWDAQEIRWYLDGTLRFTATKAQVEAGGGVWPFNQNFHILLNVAVGGNFTGVNSRKIVETDYPVSMLVDYVRVSQATTCTPTSYVNLTSPTNNSSFTAGSDITVTANASFVNGTVSRMEFFDGAASIGVDSTSPYSIVYSGATLGTHSLTAVATDALGTTLTSSAVSVAVTQNNPTPAQSPYLGSAWNIPGKVEAENYDIGGQTIAYYDLTTGNTGGVYRSDDVDIQTTTEGYEVNSISAGEWLEYTVNVTAGTYTIDAKATGSQGSFDISFDGFKAGTITLAKGGAVQTISITGVSLTAGQKVMRIDFNTALTKFNYLNFTRTGAKMASIISVDDANTANALEVYPNPTANSSNVKLNIEEASNAEYTVVNAMGIEVAKGKLSSNLETIVNLAGMEKGIYFVKVVANEQVYIEKIVKE